MGNSIHPVLGFIVSEGTCYQPNLFFAKKCNKCQYRKYVLCEESPNYKKSKDKDKKEKE